MLNRRGFLKQGLIAAAFAATGKGTAEVIGSLNKSNHDEHLNTQQGTSRPEPSKISVNDAVQSLAKEYEIKPEAAQRLYDARVSQIGNYLAAGAGISSAYISIDNADPESVTEEKKPSRLFQAIAGSLAARIGGVIGNTVNSITSPEYVASEYGMTPKNAQRFCARHKELLANQAQLSGTAVSILRSTHAAIQDAKETDSNKLPTPTADQ